MPGPEDAVPARRKRLSPDQRRAELLASADEIVRTKGLDGLTVEGLASAAAVNRALIYHYFGGWDGVVCALQEQAFAAFRTALDGRLAEHDEPEAQLRALVRYWLDYDEPARAHLVEFDRVRINAALDAQRTRQAVESALAVAQLLQSIEPVSDEVALLVAATLLDGANGFIATWRFFDWAIERGVDLYTAMTLGALRSTQAEWVA